MCGHVRLNPSTTIKIVVSAALLFLRPDEPRDEQYMYQKFVTSRCAHISCLVCGVPAVATSDLAKSVIGAWWRDTEGCHGKLRRPVERLVLIKVKHRHAKTWLYVARVHVRA